MVASFDYIDQRIAYFEEATKLNRATPGREGNTVVLTEEIADEVLIAGDLHGHRANFRAILTMANLKNNPMRHLVLQEVCHGGPTYPANGGCMSHGLLEEVAKLKTEFPKRVHFLLGNHELSELTDYPIQKGGQMLNLLFRLGMQQMYGAVTDKVREAFSLFMTSCPVAIRLDNGIFVSHSIPDTAIERRFDVTCLTRKLELADYHERTGVFELVWGRDFSQENADAFADLVGADTLITGHEPCPEGIAVPNDRQVVIDCCSDTAAVALLPLGKRLTQAEILKCVHPLKKR